MLALTHDRDSEHALIPVPNYVGMQALNAWLAGHELGLLLEGPDPDSEPLINGIVVAQHPAPPARLNRWDVVTVWVRVDPGDLSGVREPRRPPPRPAADAAERGHSDDATWASNGPGLGGSGTQGRAQDLFV